MADGDGLWTVRWHLNEFEDCYLDIIYASVVGLRKMFSQGFILVAFVYVSKMSYKSIFDT